MRNPATKHLYALALIGILLSACHARKSAIPNDQTAETGSHNDTVTPLPQPENVEILWIPGLRQPTKETPPPTAADCYEAAYQELKYMLDGVKPLDFKRAVYLTENAYYGDSLSYAGFQNDIAFLTSLCHMWMTESSLQGYEHADSVNVLKNAAIFHVIKDSAIVMRDLLWANPPKYNFSDFSGEQDWENQFVNNLLWTGTGNCHSLPFLYKILANEIGAEAYLSLAPNHIYLKHRNKWLGWYNTELTSGQFPTDAWIKASGYITLDAIRNGIYMDTLSQSQSVALCAFDLAKGYENKTRNYTDGFILKACDLALTYHPSNVNAMILKAETLRRNYDALVQAGNRDLANSMYNDMQQLYLKALELGYRNMPKEMYVAWLQAANGNDEKFFNQEINRKFNPTTKQ